MLLQTKACSKLRLTKYGKLALILFPQQPCWYLFTYTTQSSPSIYIVKCNFSQNKIGHSTISEVKKIELLERQNKFTSKPVLIQA